MRVPLCTALLGITLASWAPAQVQWQVAAATTPVQGPCVGWVDGASRLNVFTFTNGETWRLSSSSIWTQLAAPTNSPSSRLDAALAWSNTRGRAVLFGGRDAAGSLLSDTWQFDGQNWTQLHPATTPTARQHAGAASDPISGDILLVAGEGAIGGAPIQLSDTWRFDGVDWRPVPGAGPSGAARVASRIQTLLALAGNGTFVWNGSWSALGGAVQPPPRTGGAMAFDSFRGRTVLYGGASPTGTRGDVWEHDGSTWRERDPLGVTVMPHQEHALLFDAYTQTVRCFAGVNIQPNGSGGTTTLVDAEHLIYTAIVATSVRDIGAGCTTLPIAISAPQGPWVGATCFVSVSLGSGQTAIIGLGLSDRTFGGQPLPLSLPSLGPACTLFIAPDVQMAVVSRANRATVQVAIPDQPSLAGLRFYAQAAIPDTFLPSGLALTNAIELRIGSS